MDARFSVIIPLEFHRGAAERCVRAWLAQTHPAAQVELILVAPDELPRAEREPLRALLRPGDRVLDCQAHHDMGLVAAGAAAARNEFLFFTESHCWPEPDVLARVAAAFGAHPGWAGLSCGSLPVTSNRLGAVEAATFDRDIQAAMRHPWRRILDQCFAVRREAYQRAGGFEADLGHFAEWVLSARFHRLGLELGYLPEAGVHHLYLGDLAVWREFTADFTDGEMRFHARVPRDPCADLFDAVDEWENRHGWDPALARALLRVLAREPRRVAAAGLVALARRLSAPAGVTPMWLAALARERLVRLAVHACLRAVPRALPPALAWYVGTVTLPRRLGFLRGRPAATATGSAWSAGTDEDWPIFGFHGREQAGGETFRWSRPLAMIGFSVEPGAHVAEIVLAAFPRAERPAAPRFYWNGARVAADVGDGRFRLAVTGAPGGVNHLAWACDGGIPVTRVAITPRRDA